MFPTCCSGHYPRRSVGWSLEYNVQCACVGTCSLWWGSRSRGRDQEAIREKSASLVFGVSFLRAFHSALSWRMAKRGRKQTDSEHSAAQEPRPRGSVQNGTPHSHWTLMVLFLSLVLDLLGFTVILPLIPSILEYYRHNDQVNHLLVGCTNQLFSIIFPGRRM